MKARRTISYFQRIFALLLITAISAAAQVHAEKQPEKSRPLRWSADRPVDIRHIALDLRVDLAGRRVDATAMIELIALRDVSVIRLDAVNLEVSEVTLARDPAPAVVVRFVNDGSTLEIRCPEALLERQKATLRIRYSVTSPAAGLHFFAPSDAEPDVPLTMWSHGEPLDNRYWIPCLDHPGEFQTTELIVNAPQGFEVVSNGRLLSRAPNRDGTTTFHWLQDKPHAAYLISLVVAEFYTENDEWRGRPVRYYVPSQHRADLRRSFSRTTAMLDFFSDFTGVEYPWDQYAQVCVEQFPFGGMENTSASTLSRRTLHDERAHLDFSSDGLVAHELAHQWFGDLVTCRDWAHIWLNEGFATYFDALFMEHDLGKDEFDYEMLRNMRSAIEAGRKRPVVDRRYEHADEMFDGRAYPKGASILHMLRADLGTDLFRRSVRRYLTDNAHQPVETYDLRKAFESESGRSLERFFYDWTERPGAPVVDVTFDWQEEEGLARVTIRQTQDGEPFEFPLELTFALDDETATRKVDVTEKEQRLYLPFPSRPTLVLVDSRQAVLMELKEKKGRDLWSKQLREGPGIVDRIRAARHFGESKSDGDVKLLREALRLESFWGVGVEIATALGKIGGEKARDALLDCLTLEHPKVRRECASQLGSYRLDEKVAEALKSLIEKSDPSYRVEAAAISSFARIELPGATDFLTSLLSRDSHQEQIRNAALGGLGRQTDPTALETLLTWIPRGKPRECRIAALRAVGNFGSRNVLSDVDSRRVVDAVVASMLAEKRRIQVAAIQCLRDLGRASQPSLPVLEALAANDPESRVRTAAEEALTRIRAAQPGHVELSGLRDELRKLREENREQRERLEKLEARASAVDLSDSD